MELLIHLLPILQNYFPMVRAAYIEDELSRLVLVGDRAHGAASQASGQLEVDVVDVGKTHDFPPICPLLTPSPRSCSTGVYGTTCPGTSATT